MSTRPEHDQFIKPVTRHDPTNPFNKRAGLTQHDYQPVKLEKTENKINNFDKMINLSK